MKSQTREAFSGGWVAFQKLRMKLPGGMDDADYRDLLLYDSVDEAVIPKENMAVGKRKPFGFRDFFVPKRLGLQGMG